MFFWTAEPMTAQGPRKGESSSFSMRNGFRTQPARLVRGSSRRIMSMRFRPAYISVINRRASALAVVGPAVQDRTSRLTKQERVPAGAAHPCSAIMPERCSQARVRFAASNPAAPLPAARRSGQTISRRAAPAGTLEDLMC